MSEIKWQPIETAPKDGTEFLSIRAGDHVDIARWNHDEYVKKSVPYFSYRRSLSKLYDRLHQPSHWMPLPDPPSAEGR